MAKPTVKWAVPFMYKRPTKSPQYLRAASILSLTPWRGVLQYLLIPFLYAALQHIPVAHEAEHRQAFRRAIPAHLAFLPEEGYEDRLGFS